MSDHMTTTTPSDKDLDALARAHAVPGHATMINHRSFARALLARYAAPAVQPVTEDQVIQVARALEQRRALAIVDAVHNLDMVGRNADMPTAFQAGACMACEEIAHRLRTEEWTHCLKPVGYKYSATPSPKAEPASAEPGDAEMLDWLEERHYALHPVKEDQGDDTYTLWWQVIDKEKSISGHPLGNIRAALRAAMKQEKP